MIRHLRGSLSSNITEINKGGGCPPIKSPIKNHSVLRYFSRQTNAIYAGVTGVIGDGGHVFNGVLSGTSVAYSFNPQSHENPHFNLNLSYPDVAPDMSSFHGQRNYLNLWNLSEIVGLAPAGTIQNIELADEVVARDGSNYYNYNLYKKNHTMTITPVGLAPVSKTAELMEFVYLHAFIPKCRAGELYIEIEDFDLTGAVVNDYLIYVYYWETTTDERTIASAFENVNDYLSGNTNLLLTDQENTCVKVMKLSDLQGTGTDNKLIIWLNRLKTKQEKFGVNVLIGLKPQELRRDEITALGYPGYTANQVIEYDECADIVFKFKKATIKTKRFATSINNSPMAFPDFGYKNLYLNTFADNNHYIKIPIHSLDINNNAIANYTNPTVVFGPPNGGALVFIGDTWRFQENYIPFYTSFDSDLSPFIRYSDSVISSFTVYNFFQTTEALDPTQTYRLKLPMITNAGAYKISVNGGSYSLPPTVYYDIMAAHATDYVINIYVGDPLTFNPGSTYPRYRTFLDSLILLESFSVAQLTDGLITCNSGSDPEIGSPSAGVVPVIGSPYYGYDEIDCKKNKYRFIEFLGSDVSPLSMPLYFYMSIERPSTPIKTISYAPVNVGGLYYPTGYNHPNTTSEQAQFRVIAEYVRPYWGGSDNTLYKNYDCMLFKAPQIIAKTATPSAENYFV